MSNLIYQILDRFALSRTSWGPPMAAVENFVINQAKISEQVYEYLRGAIMTGRFAPGQRLDMEELVGQLKVSKMPIKEAVARLASEGLL
ncbi:MAG TPA: GntR family transcriptional regulator, partial [Terriglobia bacterium]|nr:GntR family transcriptional regulator [Terriglobia bacterium]